MEKELQERGKILIDRRQLREKVPIAERTIFNMEKEGEFPRRIVLSPRKVAWDLAEIEEWIEGRRTSGIQACRPPRKR